MEWIEGKQLKEELNTTEKKGAWKGKWLEKAGKMVAQLHAAGIIHGDLTTSNFLVGKKELVLIDFGLGFFSEKNEDRAVDLLNFKKTFLATHASFPKGLEPFLHAYSGNNPFALPVLRQMEKVENRIRYA
jgi:Kae1-associated kinase Bud32